MSRSTMDHYSRWEQLREAREEAAELLRRVTRANEDLKKITEGLEAHDRALLGAQSDAVRLEADIQALRDMAA